MRRVGGECGFVAEVWRWGLGGLVVALPCAGVGVGIGSNANDNVERQRWTVMCRGSSELFYSVMMAAVGGCVRRCLLPVCIDSCITTTTLGPTFFHAAFIEITAVSPRLEARSTRIVHALGGTTYLGRCYHVYWQLKEAAKSMRRYCVDRPLGAVQNLSKLKMQRHPRRCRRRGKRRDSSRGARPIIAQEV